MELNHLESQTAEEQSLKLQRKKSDPYNSWHQEKSAPKPFFDNIFDQKSPYSPARRSIVDMGQDRPTNLKQVLSEFSNNTPQPERLSTDERGSSIPRPFKVNQEEFSGTLGRPNASFAGGMLGALPPVPRPATGEKRGTAYRRMFYDQDEPASLQGLVHLN